MLDHQHRPGIKTTAQGALPAHSYGVATKKMAEAKTSAIRPIYLFPRLFRQCQYFPISLPQWLQRWE